jgi:hypothetical protein
MDKTAAKKVLVGDIVNTGEGTLDETADALLERIAAFFGECAGADDFCGLSIDETRDADGCLTSLKLVPCDLVGGEPCRREGRFAIATTSDIRALTPIAH